MKYKDLHEEDRFALVHEILSNYGLHRVHGGSSDYQGPHRSDPIPREELDSYLAGAGFRHTRATPARELSKDFPTRSPHVSRVTHSYRNEAGDTLNLSHHVEKLIDPLRDEPGQATPYTGPDRHLYWANLKTKS